MSVKNSNKKTQRMVVTAFFIALIVVLQLIANYFKVGAVSISLVLVPITVGAIMFGPAVGSVLGCTFGIICFLYGLFGLDPFTLSMIQFNPLGTVLICLVKGTAAGLVPALLFKLFNKITNEKTVVSAAIGAIFAPVFNTGLFLVGGSTIFKDYFEASGMPGTVLSLFAALAAAVVVNFVFELVSNTVISPIIVKYLSKNKSFRQLYK